MAARMIRQDKRLARAGFLALGATAALAGCAAAGSFPSVARRPQEDGRITGTVMVPAVAAAPSAPQPPGESDATTLLEQARAAHVRFAEKRPAASTAVGAAQGSSAGSEAWARAAVALADLTAQRDALASALADIDARYVREKVDGDDGGAIAAVRDQVTAWVAEDDAVLAELGGRGPA